MSTIVKKGRDPAKPWIDKSLTCKKCRCKFRLDADDKVEQDCRREDCFLDDLDTACPIHFVVACPHCKHDVEFEAGRKS